MSSQSSGAPSRPHTDTPTPTDPPRRRRGRRATRIGLTGLLTALVLAAIVPLGAAQAGVEHRERTGGGRSKALAPVVVTYPGLSVAWPAALALPDSSQVVRGGLTAPMPAPTVTLQRLVLGQWVDVASTAATALGTFTLSLPTSYLGHFTYRLRITGSGGSLIETPPQAVTVVPSYVPRGSPTSFALISSSPVGRWDPCDPISVRVNTGAAPKGVLPDVVAALAQVSQATGLRFEYLGETTVVPFADAHPFDTAVADLVIAWARPSQLPGAFPTGTYGIGGPEMRAGAHDLAGNPVRRIYQGGVTINAAFNQVLKPGAGRGATRVAALMHEIGHAVGLFHVTGDPAELMTPSLGNGPSQWGAGDLAGLEAVGAANGCVYGG
jgi:hypothetical protein